MSSNTIYGNGEKEVLIAASDKLAIYSAESVKVYQQKGYPNVPKTWDLLTTIAADTEYQSAAFSAATNVRIEAGAADVRYAAGVDAVITERIGLRTQGTPGVLDATGALTAAMIVTGLVTSAAATVAGTVPTGTVMDAAVEMAIDEAIDWSLVKVGANDFTVTAATGHTLVGVAVVSTATSALFRTRKTAANTFVTYRLAG